MLSWLRGIPWVDTLEARSLSLCYMTFFFRFRIYYRIADSQGQFGGDIVPGVLAQFIIMMHSLGKLFSKIYSFHYNVELKRNPRELDD